MTKKRFNQAVSSFLVVFLCFCSTDASRRGGGRITGFGFGMSLHGDGGMNPFLSTLGPEGRILDMHEFCEKEPEIPRSILGELRVPSRSSEEWQRASLTFEIMNNRPAYNFGVYNLRGIEYHFAKSADTEMLTLPARQWTISNYAGFDAFTTFTAHDDTERLAMQSFKFEETPLLWHFGRELIGGKWYNHAWTDTFLDMLIPAGKIMYVSAPEGYTRERKERARAAAAAAAPTPSWAAQEEKSNDILRESLWAATHAANAAKFRQETEARTAAAAAYEYYTKTREFVVDMFVPGGIENCRRYARHEISTVQFLDNIATDVRNDVICGMLGSLIGAGTGGAAGALASGGAMAIPGAVIGAKEGAAIGLAISRTIKAGIRSSSSSSSSSGSSHGGAPRTSVVRQRSTPEEQRRFLDRKLDSREWVDRGHKIGGEKAYYEPETDLWYTAVKREKNDFEVWRVSGKKAKHQGAIEPKNGTMYEGPKHTDATFE